MVTESLISKVQKLLRLAGNNSNAEEAAAAAAKAQQLIDQHNLSAAMLAIEESEPVESLDEDVIDFEKAGAPLDNQKTQQTWRVRLASCLADLNGCRIYLHGTNIALVGRPTDAETVRYLYGYLTRETERLTTERGNGMGRTWRNNFRLGVVDTVRRRLYEQHRVFESTARAVVASDNAALVKVDRALALINKKTETVDLFMKKTLKLRSSGPISSHAQGNNQARAHGREAGKSIGLNQARGGLTSGAKALKS